VLGAFGTILSDFTPPAIATPPTLSALTVTPAIATSDSPGRVAKGQVMIEKPAPPGGVAVALSSDRPDVTNVSPFVLWIPAGDNPGDFTVSAVAQPSMPSTSVDVTVSASIGNQTLRTPLSVQPKPPTTGPVVVGGLFSAPVTGVPGVASLELFTPPPLPRTT